ncbi:MAG: MFS transporter [Chlamydiia bacterium]|nr:MFS transporter [Chlamydiia bacterium]
MNLGENTRSWRTQIALLWMHLTAEPLIALRTALSSYVLYADYGGSVFQVGLCHSIRPVMALLSFYWGARLSCGRSGLKANLMGAWVLARLPFVFIPFVESSWYLLFCEAAFYAFHRGSMPALMEILKINLPQEKRNKAFSLSFLLQFAESIFLGTLFGALLMKSPGAWKGLFCFTALLGITSVFFQRHIPLPHLKLTAEPKQTWKERLVEPWKKSIELLKNRPDFARFQWGFMIGGFGLMLISPALTMYAYNVIQASHADVTIARTVFMGWGVVCSIYYWQRYLSKAPPRKLLGSVICGFALYSFVLLLAQFHMSYYFMAFVIYGVAQAGSHLLWHLSGPLFAKHEDSSGYTMVNVLAVGVRGLVAPALGSLLCQAFGCTPVLMIGTCILAYGSWRAFTAFETNQPKAASKA